MKKAIVLAAGRGTRMNSPLPKVLHEVGGKPMVLHLLDTLKKAAMDEIVVVTQSDKIVDAEIMEEEIKDSSMYEDGTNSDSFFDDFFSDD